MADLRMPDINNVIIVGNLIKDPVFRHTTTGTPVTNFYIASNRKFKDNMGNWKEDVCFVGIVAWYKLAESCYENLRKGSAVLVEGELQSRNWKTEDGYNRNVVEIKARRIQFLNKREYTSNDFYSSSSKSDDFTETDSGTEDKLPAAATGEKAPETESASVVEKKSEPLSQEKQSDSDDSASVDTASKGTDFDFGYKDLKL
ncbi:MAG: single-stranded DNA-binding protein [FCB group bacterium]|nr:single-stranded DNA-binding protein [FCB group bacterium]